MPGRSKTQYGPSLRRPTQRHSYTNPKARPLRRLRRTGPARALCGQKESPFENPQCATLQFWQIVRNELVPSPQTCVPAPSRGPAAPQCAVRRGNEQPERRLPPKDLYPKRLETIASTTGLNTRSESDSTPATPASLEKPSRYTPRSQAPIDLGVHKRLANNCLFPLRRLEQSVHTVVRQDVCVARSVPPNDPTSFFGPTFSPRDVYEDCDQRHIRVYLAYGGRIGLTFRNILDIDSRYSIHSLSYIPFVIPYDELVGGLFSLNYRIGLWTFRLQIFRFSDSQVLSALSFFRDVERRPYCLRRRSPFPRIRWS